MAAAERMSTDLLWYRLLARVASATLEYNTDPPRGAHWFEDMRW